MQGKRDNTEIRNTICKAAAEYKRQFVGKTFLVVYDGKCHEVLFKADNFQHLCGVESRLYAKDFFKRAVNNNLNKREIYFSKDHPYALAKKKLNALLELMDIFSKDCCIVTNMKTQTRTYRFGITDMSILLCMDNQYNGKQKVHDYLIPYSFRVENIDKNRYEEKTKIDYIFEKPIDDKQYSKMIYGDKETLSEYLENRTIPKINMDAFVLEEEYER